VSTLKVSSLSKEANITGEYVDYAPIDYFSAWYTMHQVEIEDKDVFVDFGAGRGRVLLIAARFSFRRIIGVELDAHLAESAQQNLSLAKKRLRCEDVEVVQGDAVEFNLPQTATVLHFFHPFYGVPLEQVVRNVVRSMQETPRKLTILFANPFDFERIVDHTDIIPRSWIKKKSCHRWPLFESDGVGNLYRVYHLSSL